MTSESFEGVGPDDDLAAAIEAFEPLEHEAGQAAGNWLRLCLSEKRVGLETHLAWGDDPRELLGIYVVRFAAFLVSSEDRRLLGLVKRYTEEEQPGLLLELIARDRRTSAGFGRELVDHALANALEQGVVALLVGANERVAEKVWRRHRFVPFTDPRVPAPGMTVLMHPVREPRSSLSR